MWLVGQICSSPNTSTSTHISSGNSQSIFLPWLASVPLRGNIRGTASRVFPRTKWNATLLHTDSKVTRGQGFPPLVSFQTNQRQETQNLLTMGIPWAVSTTDIQAGGACKRDNNQFQQPPQASVATDTDTLQPWRYSKRQKKVDKDPWVPEKSKTLFSRNQGVGRRCRSLSSLPNALTSLKLTQALSHRYLSTRP